MQESSFQTLGEIDFVHPFHNLFQTVLSRGEQCFRVQIRSISRPLISPVIWKIHNQLEAECCESLQMLRVFYSLVGFARSRRPFHKYHQSRDDLITHRSKIGGISAINLRGHGF